MSRIAASNNWYQVNSPDAWASGVDALHLSLKPNVKSLKSDLTTQILPPPTDVPIDTWFQLPANSSNQLNWDAFVIPPPLPPADLSPSSPWDGSSSSSDKLDKGSPQRNIDIEAELSRQNLYKTELCRSWVESAMCKYGTKCQFAHGKHELRPVIRHPKYKTEICKTFHTNGTCPYGKRCRFVHNPVELRSPGSDSSEADINEDFVADILPQEEVVTEEQRAIEEKIAQLRLGLLAPDPVFSPPAAVEPERPVPAVVPPKKTGSRLPFFQKLRKQKT